MCVCVCVCVCLYGGVVAGVNSNLCVLEQSLPLFHDPASYFVPLVVRTSVFAILMSAKGILATSSIACNTSLYVTV